MSLLSTLHISHVNVQSLLSENMTNSLAYFQLGALNSEKDKYLRKKEETLFETNMKLWNMRFEKIKIWEGVVTHKKVVTKDFSLKIYH